jgi:DeoR/GlpR family transcriptional regulator of sugar metabolism
MDTRNRRATIVERLRADGEASIVELALYFGTSEMTIRRDLELLEQKGLARRARGGAISVQSRSFEPPILQRAAHMAEAKRRIGVAAAGLLHEGETVVIDIGTTTHEMAKAIAPDLDVTVVTSSLLIATALSTKPRVRTIVTGGELRHDEMSLIGAAAEAALENFNCDSVYLGVAGLSVDKGLSEYNVADAAMKRAAMAAGRRVVVLADATKLGRVTFATVAPLERVDLLVTNADPEDETIRRVRETGVDVLHVAPYEKEMP